MTLAPPCPAIPAPAPPIYPPPPTSVSFGPVTLEDLTYANLPQVPYPPPAIYEVDDLALTARTTAEEIRQAALLQAFLAPNQRRTLGALPETVTHPEDTLLQYYAEEGIPADTGPPWSRTALDEANRNNMQASVCALDMVRFI